ncbi:hypothetical protein DB347_00785 [Opitutaceae bacterium EW11]|nr:hypothetical protein DB347_00785 [Opitutaceae bacterium EW11]
MNPKTDLKHTGQEPYRRPPDDEPERRGEGELDGPEDAGPAAGSAQMRDEDYARTDQPLLPDSTLAAALHEHPPQGKEQLQPGSGGDAARAGREGTAGKPIPPREDL